MVHCSRKGMDMASNNTQVGCGILTVLNWYKCAKKIPPTPLNHHHQPEPLRQRLSCSLRQILTLSSECNSRNPDSSHVSNLLLSNFGDPVWIVASVSCSYLTEWQPVWFSAAGTHLLQGSTCCVFRYVFCRTWLVIWVTVVFLSSLTSPFSSDINKALSSTQLPLTGYFIFFGPFSVNPRDGCVWKSQ